jgi:DNA modification methylase
MSTRILIGDCRARMRELEARSIACCVTSPPYFGLRDYGVDGQLGLEATPEQFVAELVDVFREVHRVLRDDGTLWLNLGDSYAGSGRGGYPAPETSSIDGSRTGQDQSRLARKKQRAAGEIGGTARQAAVTQRGSRLPAGLHESARQAGAVGRAWVPAPAGLKQKDLIGVPWMVAFALRADGWFLRSDIIWSKPNPMPESVEDRPTKAHEYLFLLSKSDRYFYDAAAIAEPASGAGQIGTGVGWGRLDRLDPDQPDRGRQRIRKSGNLARKNGSARGCPEGTGQNVCGSVPWEGTTRNRRTVWSIPTQPFSDAHFATFPPKLIEPCILAGSREGDTVLDPFFGAGTTGLVADRLKRSCIGIELNPAYAEMARKRIADDHGMFGEVDAA